MNQMNNFPVAQQVYFSTHNALRAGESEVQKFVLYIDELDGTKRILLSIYPFYDCQMVKRLVIKYLDLPEGTSIRDIQLFYRGVEIPNGRFMHIFEKQRHPLHYSLRMNKSDFGIRSTGLKWSNKIQKLVIEVKLAMQRNVHPKLTLDGTGATYRMYSAKGQVVAMFKPLDEEAFSPNNPRGYQGKLGQQGFRSGVLSGEGASREVATAIWDAYYHNFAGVPDTTLLEACHQAFNYDGRCKINLDWGDIFEKDNAKLKNITLDWKLGAFQEFISTTETVGNFNPSVFCIRDVHRIGILDICLFNLDRNDSNILVVTNQSNYSIKFNMNNLNTPGSSIAPYEHPLSTPDGKKTKYKLVPIDHGLCLPDVLDVAQFDWVWFDWPHSKIPFGRSELRVIKYMDPDADAERLKRKLLIRSECLRSMRVSVRWLKLASSMHLTLFQIASFLCREDLEVPSSIELLIQRSLQHCYRAFDATALISSNRLGNIHIDLATTSSAPSRARVLSEVPKDGLNASVTNSLVDKCECPEFSDSDSDSDSGFSSDNSTIRSKWWESRKTRQKSSQSQKADVHLGTSEQLTPSSFQKSCLNGVSRNTAYRNQLLLGLAPQNSTWMLFDKENNIIPIQWGDKHFEHVFFDVLEQEMKHLIVEKHPKWEEYPYFGEEVLNEGKASGA